MAEICRFDEHAGTCDWIACENPDPSSPSSCLLPWPKADSAMADSNLVARLRTVTANSLICREAADELVRLQEVYRREREAHGANLKEQQKCEADLAQVVIANAEVAKLNAEQAETIERLKVALAEAQSHHQLLHPGCATELRASGLTPQAVARCPHCGESEPHTHHATGPNVWFPRAPDDPASPVSRSEHPLDEWLKPLGKST